MSKSAEFGTFDSMRDAMQTDYLAALPASIERLRFDPSELAAHQTVGLRSLLVHAAAHSPFHRERLTGIDLDRFELADLACLPVMTKTEMMDNLAAVFTDPRLTPAIVERALAATTTEPVPIFGDYLALTSGGSSGRRGVFVLDRRAAVQFIASLSRSLVARLAAAGGPPPGGLRVAMVGAPSAVHATGSASAWTAGPGMPIHFIATPATLPLPEIVDRLNALDAPMLAGYPTMLARLADERRAGRLRIAPRMLSSTSESLHPHLRASITDGFGVPLVDIFGSTEGLVGTSAPDDEVLVFNSDVCITELVDENDQPVSPGTPSAKVLVTNLSNHVQPLIRYAITDCFVGQPNASEHGLLRATVDGRADEVLRYDDVDVHPIAVRAVLVRCPEVLDYQVHQTQRGMAVSALATRALDADVLRGRLTDALRGAGLIDAEVTVQTVDTLQRHQETGKLRRFVPLVMSRE